MAKHKKTTTPVEEEMAAQLNVYRPSDGEREIISRVWKRFTQMKEIRDRQYHFFNNRNLTSMIDDSQKRFNGWIEPRSGPEDWGAKTIDPMTRNKVIFILATLASQRLKAQFFKEDDDDVIRAKIVEAFHEHSYINENEEIHVFNEMLSAVVKGTVIGYESYKAPLITFKRIDDVDLDTGEVKYKDVTKRIFNNVFSEIVPIEDFYPGDIKQRDVQKMPDLVWRSVLNIDIFKAEMSRFPNIDYVRPGGDLQNEMFFKDHASDGLANDEVEVIRYFNKVKDEMHIIANGVLLTPLVSPLIWNHKEKGLGFPFWSTIYEPFDEFFFYGKPLPDKLKSNQDVVDALYRMLLDQTFLSIHKPILTSSVKDIEDDLIRPGRKIPVDDVNEWKELNISSPDGGQFKMLEIARRSVEESSNDSITGGRSGGKSSVTATEVATAKQGAETLLSMFQKFMEWGAEKKAILRVSNQLQFYPLPIGEEDGKLKYRKIRVDNVPLILTPRVGSLIIKFVASKKDLPKTPAISEEYRSRFEEKYGKNFDHIAVERRNERVEEVTITPEFLEDFSVGVRIVADSSVKMSEGMKKAMTFEFIDRVVQIFPDLINRNAVARDLIEEFKKSPDEYLITSPAEQEMALYRAQEIKGAKTQDRDFGRSSQLVDQMTGGGQAAEQSELGALNNPKTNLGLGQLSAVNLNQ